MNKEKNAVLSQSKLIQHIMQKNLQILVVACIALLISSCQLDRWTTGTLDYSFYPTTDYYGYFKTGAVYQPQDINISGSFDYINQFALKRSTMEIEGDLYAGDIIRNLTVDIAGAGVFVVGDVVVYQKGYVNVIDTNRDDAFYDFMYRAFSYMNKNGSHDIIVSGTLMNKGSYIRDVQLKITFYNDLDVQVSNY